MERFSNRSLPDSVELRERILDAVEQAIDRVEEVANDAPSVDDLVRGVRRRRIARGAGTTFVAFAPTVVRAARSRYAHARRGSHGLARYAPVAVRTHPVVFGVGMATTVVVGAIAIRRAFVQRARQLERHVEDLEAAHDTYVEEVDPKHFDLAEEVMRMEGEGGDPSAGAADTTKRRFVRQGNGSRVSSS